MAKAKPTKNLDTLGLLSLSPEKYIEFYGDSKKLIFGKEPNADSTDEASIELLWFQNEQEHKNMLQVQAELVEHAALQDTINSNRILELHRMQDDLRKRFEETNRFLIDCDEKRKFGEFKCAEERKVHEELRSIIQKYKKDLGGLKKFREELRKTVKQFEPYEVVINQVVESSSLYSSEKDCIDRCDALMLTEVEIAKMIAKKIQAIEELRLEMVKMTNEAALAILGFNNELTELERAYTNACAECYKYEKILVSTKKIIADTQQMMSKTIDGISNMCRALCKRGETPAKVLKSDIQGQMDFIWSEMKILQKIAQECEKKVPVHRKK